ncbi:hydrogenase iron-sulfur subunit [Bacteroidota bacterium]
MGKESKNIGVYICSGCNIADAIDTAKLKSIAEEHQAVKLCQQHPILCSAEAYLKINDEIDEHQFDSLVFAGCSPRHATESFNFSEIHTERVSLRENVAWVMEAGHEDTQMAAEDYLRMGIARTAASGLPDPYVPDAPESDILVLGGGITGIQSVLEGARAGYSVVLVEKEDKLGGWLNKWHDIIPASGSRETHLGYFLDEKLEELKNSPLITLHTNTTIESIEGEPGKFLVKLRNGSVSSECQVGSVILANGWKPYDPAKLTKLGYSDHQNVITQIELEAMKKEDRILRPSDGKVPENIVFIQCAGSRGKDHLTYCSNVCCLTSLKQVSYIRQKYPESKIFIVYKDIRTPGKDEHYYRSIQDDSSVFFTKGRVDRVEKLENDSLKIVVDNNLLGELISIRADLLIAATGMEPNQSEDLHLLYRKGEGLPERKYGFPDSHFICFPYETQRTGIYAAGAVRTPQGIQSCMEDASGAVVKAIQCIESVKRGEAVHPRSGDKSYPDLYMQRCTDCKRCTEECPFGSYDETEKGTPLPNPARCRRCGICMGSCPERIINFDNYSIHAISSMIKSIPIPDEFEEKPRVLAFVCENDAYPAFDLAALHRHRISPWLRIIPVRCIGSINKIWLSDALSAGFDGIIQIGCKPGDDYQCHFITGSELMETRSENIQETLQTMMLEPERIETVFLEIDEYHRIPEIIEEYMETIEEIGPNPFKDM